MTNREAIKEIQERIDFHEKLYPDAVPEYHDALTMAISALEKQEPEEPDNHVTDEKTWFCPRCHVAYKDVQPYYCFRCGQKLKWETWQYQIEF